MSQKHNPRITQKHNGTETGKPKLSRRRFITSTIALSAISLSKTAPDVSAAEFESIDPISADPGYVGPQFFDKEEERALLEVLESGSPFRYWGPKRPEKVKRFEEEFAKYMGVKYALAVTSGTAALNCAMAGLNIGPGDEVIVPAYTWWSDYTCVVHSCALPVFANIDRTLNIDPADFERKITPRTKAVIAVHLLGGPCNMDAIMAIARKHNIAVVEDCAQCVGGSYRGKKLGSIGDVGIYSFQINKMITSGEGGALVTNNPVIYERACRFHDMGLPRAVFIERIGSSSVPTFAGENYRMNEFSGGVLLAQLKKLDLMISKLRENARLVYDGIKDIKAIRLRDMPDPEGDIGTGVFFGVVSRQLRDQWITQLRNLKVPASTLSGSVILPVEESVINKRARHPAWPSFTTEEGRKIKYGAETCQQTIDIHNRFIMIRIGVKFTPRICKYLVESIRKVCHK